MGANALADAAARLDQALGDGAMEDGHWALVDACDAHMVRLLRVIEQSGGKMAVLT